MELEAFFIMFSKWWGNLCWPKRMTFLLSAEGLPVLRASLQDALVMPGEDLVPGPV